MTTAATWPLIDQVIAAYQDFIRLTGWIAHLSLTLEQELFCGEEGSTGRLADSPHERSLYRRSAVERHLVQLRERLLPLVECRGALMRETLAGVGGIPSRTAERDRGRARINECRARPAVTKTAWRFVAG